MDRGARRLVGGAVHRRGARLPAAPSSTRIAPNNPVVLQSVYNHSYLNSAALKAANIDESTANPPGGTIEKDAGGKLDRRGARRRRRRLRRRQGPARRPGDLVRQHAQAGGVSELARHHRLVGPRRPRHERAALRAVSPPRRRAASSTCGCSGSPSASRRRRSRWTRCSRKCRRPKPFQGNDYFDHIGWGESIYAPATTNTMRADGTDEPGGDWRRCAASREALAEHGIHLNAHVEMQTAIDAFLDAVRGGQQGAPDQGAALGRSRISTRSPRRSSSA